MLYVNDALLSTDECGFFLQWTEQVGRVVVCAV